MTIYCTGCKKDVEARLTDGKELYPSHMNLWRLPFWRCDTCKSYVGCHHKTRDRTKPLGCLATREIIEARKRIHAILDPLWKGSRVKRIKAYDYISKAIGREYHTGEIRSVEEAREIEGVVVKLRAEWRKEQSDGM